MTHRGRVEAVSGTHARPASGTPWRLAWRTLEWHTLRGWSHERRQLSHGDKQCALTKRVRDSDVVRHARRRQPHGVSDKRVHNRVCDKRVCKQLRVCDKWVCKQLRVFEKCVCTQLRVFDNRACTQLRVFDKSVRTQLRVCDKWVCTQLRVFDKCVCAQLRVCVTRVCAHN